MLDEMCAFSGSPTTKLETSVSCRVVILGRFLQNVDFLRSGSVVGELGAVVLVECEIRRWKGTMLATLPETAVPFLRAETNVLL